jgi:hypothetical protein
MSRINPLIRCACGMEFPDVKAQRYHIAVVTDRWPVDRCSIEHHDPNNKKDIEYLRLWAIRKELSDGHS